LTQLFNRYDSKKQGFINSKYAIEIFKEAGQNPTIHVEESVIQETDKSSIGMMLFEDMLHVFEKYWKNRETTEMELEHALRAFTLSKLLLHFQMISSFLLI
jgi:Ca2+-binding EF-hand superfamily protein